MGGDQDVRATAIDLLGSLVGETRTKEGPIQRVLQGPAGSRVVTTDLFDDECASDGVCLQPPERTGSCHSQETRLAQCIQDWPGQASFPLCFLAVFPDDWSDFARCVDAAMCLVPNAFALFLCVDRIPVMRITSASPERCSG